MLCYRAVFVGVGESAPTTTNYISSLWSKRGDEWLNVFSQDTEVTAPN